MHRGSQQALLAIVVLAVACGASVSHAAWSPSADPCVPLNVTFVPDPNVEISRSQTEQAELFLSLLKKEALPYFNTSLEFSVELADIVGQLVTMAHSYRPQAIDLLATLREIGFFADRLNGTYLSTLMGVYRSYQAASNQPQLQAQIKSRFIAAQSLWLQAASVQMNATSLAWESWELSGNVLNAYNRLNTFVGRCQALPSFIVQLKQLIAQLEKACGGLNCPGLEEAKRNLAVAQEDLSYCKQGAEAYADKLTSAIHVMTGKLWGKVLSILHALFDDLGSARGSLGQLNLDDIIFDLNVQVTISAWTSIARESFSAVYYACRNGFIPSM